MVTAEDRMNNELPCALLVCELLGYARYRRCGRAATRLALPRSRFRRDDVARPCLDIEGDDDSASLQLTLDLLNLGLGVGQFRAIPGNEFLNDSGKCLGTELSIGDDHVELPFAAVSGNTWVGHMEPGVAVIQ